ncbi:putative restriction endonuclease [Tepidimonas alkaliphilus]|uniref:Putative restriction endonuclease n=1 Tax=Tepidimonas alkaliphilus TaxID=2588942 RepID=A0A554W4Q8_9BURK|nr:Uma2 family endonuclease [Tepidimonas alkaliphilus]TSE18562.1 putative restriction endonuclease [Tepidimonas alkaliphilus]
MTALARSETWLSPEDYLQDELVSDVRHEYVAGKVYAMVGASRTHNRIAMATAHALLPRARRFGCQVFVADMKVRIDYGGEEVYYYPDVMVACDPRDRADYHVDRPCLIVEVLSEHTERIDRREKLLAYQRIPSMELYLVVAQDRRWVEAYRRSRDWVLEGYADGAIELPCLDGTLTLDEIYADVEL